MKSDDEEEERVNVHPEEGEADEEKKGKVHDE